MLEPFRIRMIFLDMLTKLSAVHALVSLDRFSLPVNCWSSWCSWAWFPWLCSGNFPLYFVERFSLLAYQFFNLLELELIFFGRQHLAERTLTEVRFAQLTQADVLGCALVVSSLPMLPKDTWLANESFAESAVEGELYQSMLLSIHCGLCLVCQAVINSFAESVLLCSIRGQLS